LSFFSPSSFWPIRSACRRRSAPRVYGIPPPTSSPLVFKCLFFSYRGLLNRRRAKKKMIENNSSTPPPHSRSSGVGFIFRLFLRTTTRIYYNMICTCLYIRVYNMYTAYTRRIHTRFGYQFIWDIMIRTCASLARVRSCL